MKRKILKKKYVMIIGIILILLLFLVLLKNYLYKDPILQLIEDSGGLMKSPPKEYDVKYATKLIDTLLTEKEIQKLNLTPARIGNVNAMLWDWGDRGLILSYSKVLDVNTGSTFNIVIESPESIKLRHKIIIGTDMANWELIRKESNYPQPFPFKRNYVLVQKRGDNGRMVGLAFYEDAMVDIEIEGKVDNQTIANLNGVTWEVANHLEAVYDPQIKEIVEGPLFENDPVLSRPDLPDPDLSSD